MTMNELYSKIGKLLRIERTRREIQLKDMAVELRMSEANLRAIEDGDASRLPSELYFKLFAKSYAEALGIDYEATVDAIEQDLAVSKQAEAKTDTAEATPAARSQAAGEASANGARRQLKSLLYLIAAVVALFLVVVAVNELFLKDSDIRPAIDSTEVPEVESVATAVPPSDELSGYDWDVPAYHEPDPMTLMLLASAECWATVLSDGDTAVYRTLTPGWRYEVTAQYRLQVSVGVPSVVDIELNGQPVNLRDPESGRIAAVEIDQVNLAQFMARPLTVAPSTGQPGEAASGESNNATINENESQDSL